MARRKKNLTIEEELMELQKEITGCEDEIKRLTDRKKELKQLIEQKQTEALYHAVLRSGKSIDEVIAWINSDSQGEQQTEM
jgi:chromosome segregation ATPase